MKAKLIKDHADYHLVDDEQFIIGTTDESMLSCTDKQKLSLTNCQAIERGYNLDELADFYSTMTVFIKKDEIPTEKQIEDAEYISEIAFKAGFKKALELIGDKKFSEEDIRNVINRARNYYDGWIETEDEIIQSLQQTEWDVEVEMDAIPADRAPGGWDRFPKLDTDGCLIIKPLPKE